MLLQAPAGALTTPRQIVAALVTVAVCLTGCGGSKVLKEPQAVPARESLASATDERLIASLDWVIVRDGPGTWAKNADWDEYLIHLRSRSDDPVRITGVTVVDSMQGQHAPLVDRSDLVSASRETAHRYKGAGVDVKAGMGAGSLAATGLALGAAGTATAIGIMGGSVAATSAAAAAAVTGVLVAPLFIGAGVVKVVHQHKVNETIVARSSVLPVELGAGQERTVDLFFSLAPSPQGVEIDYSDAKGQYHLSIDTRQVLTGLHIATAASTASDQPPSPPPQQ